jgi:predicted patatin/cPLA2 family phospholipase
MMGTCAYMKDYFNVNSEKYIYSGASAGAWNSLFMTFNKHSPSLVNTLVQNDIYKGLNLLQVESLMKERILTKYDTSDFDLDRLFIGVTTFGQTNIYTDFNNLEDAIDCCIASSHIPFVSGGAINKYKNIYTFDGGFSNYPYLNVKKPALHISPGIWINKKNKLDCSIFFTGKFDLEKLFEAGYEDARTNFKTLASVLTHHQ